MKKLIESQNMERPKNYWKNINVTTIKTSTWTFVEQRLNLFDAIMLSRLKELEEISRPREDIAVYLTKGNQIPHPNIY